MSTGVPLLRVEDLTIKAGLAGDRTIVEGVSLAVAAGETIGIVGESGSGKSMTARAIVGLLPQAVRAIGTVAYGGRNLLALPERSLTRLRGHEIVLVFQDPFTMLSPVRRCGRHIDELLRDETGKRLSRKARRAEAVRRLREVGISDPGVAERYPFELSGGMRQRVGIASALACDPRLLIADEPSTALDVTTQREILSLLKSVQKARGMGMIMITHDLRVAFAMCDRIYVLYAGSLLEIGPSEQVQREPLHPYTLGLLVSEPPGDRRLRTLHSIPGSVPLPDSVSGRCPFAARCDWTADSCVSDPTPLRAIGPERFSACIRIEEIRDEIATKRARVEDEHVPTVVTTSPAALVEAIDVEKIFTRGKHRVVAVNGVSVEIGEGESVGLVGESGSGKTTFARCLVGLETPTGGSIRIAGIDASNYHNLGGSDLRRLRQTIQIVFQDPYSSLTPARTIGSVLAEALLARTPKLKNVDAAVRELLVRVGLPPEYARRKPVALSGGERQRAVIARALAVGPKLLICDEPVSALDVSVQAQILNLFESLRQDLGMSYLFITHDLAVVRQVVERAYVLYKGKVVEAGLIDDVLDGPSHEYTQRLVDSIPRGDETWLDPRSAAAAAKQ